VFPERLTSVIIKSVCEKGDKILTTTYRSISILSSFSKIFEEIIYSRLYKNTGTNNILVKKNMDLELIVRQRLQLVIKLMKY
jgi:hypothetical protein